MTVHVNRLIFGYLCPTMNRYGPVDLPSGAKSELILQHVLLNVNKYINTCILQNKSYPYHVFPWQGKCWSSCFGIWVWYSSHHSGSLWQSGWVGNDIRCLSSQQQVPWHGQSPPPRWGNDISSERCLIIVL